jgi:hypothetical protein
VWDSRRILQQAPGAVLPVAPGRTRGAIGICPRSPRRPGKHATYKARGRVDVLARMGPRDPTVSAHEVPVKAQQVCNNRLSSIVGCSVRRELSSGSHRKALAPHTGSPMPVSGQPCEISVSADTVSIRRPGTRR